MSDVQLPYVTVSGRTIHHNGSIWRVATNRHSNTDGSRWGWIDGAPGHECWSDNERFNSVSASEAVATHNQWLEDQKPVLIRLIEACEKQKACKAAFEQAKTRFDAASVDLERIDREVIRLTMEQASITRETP